MSPATPCDRCGGLNGQHGMIHVRHGNGGGHNSPCPSGREVAGTVPLIVKLRGGATYEARCPACHWRSRPQAMPAAIADGKRHRWDAHLSGQVAR